MGARNIPRIAHLLEQRLYDLIFMTDLSQEILSFANMGRVM
jgi:hypothetical protein